MRSIGMSFVGCLLLFFSGDFVSSLGAEVANPSEEELAAIRDVQKHLQARQLDEAEKELAAKLEAYPDSQRIHALHMNFAYAYRRDSEHAKAFAHMRQLVEYYLTHSAEEPALYRQLPNSLAAMASYSQVAEKIEDAKSQFASVIETLEARRVDQPDADEILGAIHDVRLRGIDFLIAIRDYDLAAEHLENELKLAQSEYNEKADSPAYILRLSDALKARVVLRDAIGDERVMDARKRQLAFLQSKAESHRDQLDVVTAYLDAHLSAVTALAGSDPDRAGDLLIATKSFVSTLDQRNREIQQKVLIAESSFGYLSELIESGQRHNRLIGTDSPVPEFVAWLNGEEITRDEFAGKVVLLDFWSVWCSPCIEAFPHLNRWHQEHAEAGLRIVGVTRFYNYFWDEKRSQPVKELDKEVPQRDELAMIEQFARKQQLKYPLAVTTPGSEYPGQFAVRGIPQTVLIDRAGKIRLIRVGTNPTVVRELEEMIAKLLAEKVEEKQSDESVDDNKEVSADSTQNR